MSSIAKILGSSIDNHPRRTLFMKWQCHVRQMSIRQMEGKPDEAIIPTLILADLEEDLGQIITLINKTTDYDVIPEMKYMAKKTNDASQVRQDALKFFAEAYYQKPSTFSDILTATFLPSSYGAAKIYGAKNCILRFEAYAQSFDLRCKVWRLAKHHQLYQATWWHNKLFNSSLHPDTEVLGFEADWESSTASPDIPRGHV